MIKIVESVRIYQCSPLSTETEFVTHTNERFTREDAINWLDQNPNLKIIRTVRESSTLQVYVIWTIPSDQVFHL